VKLLRDTWLIFGRAMSITLRNPAWSLIMLAQPLFFLYFFGPLLRQVSATEDFPAGGAFNVFVPGLMVQLAMFGTLFVGFGLLAELRAGVIERLRVTPVSRFALLLGKGMRDVVALLVQSVLLVLLAVPLGLTIDPLGLVVVLGLLALLGIALVSLSYTVALKVRSEDALGPLLNTITMPLLLLSGVLLPMSLAPGWLQGVASVNPVSHTVDAARALFNGNLGSPDVTIGVAVTAALALVAVGLGARAFSKAAA
jgi:ABC-2 type transport system permease protein